MTPEQDIRQALETVCPNVGHWPYTKDAGIFIGFRPSEDDLTWAGNRAIAAVISYDVVIYHRLGSAEEAEATRFAAYAALRAAGWLHDNQPGPESYIANAELFAWPFTVNKRFYLVDNQPVTADELRAMTSPGTSQPAAGG